MNDNFENTRIDGHAVAHDLTTKIAELLNSDNLTEDTKSHYVQRVNRLITELQTRQINSTPGALVDLLSERINQGEISSSTARTDKAAIAFYLADEASSVMNQGESIEEYEDAYTALRKLSARLLPNTSTKTSGSKLKYFPQEIFQALTEQSNIRYRSVSRQLMVAFLRANMLVGLRPAEWFDADLCTYLHRTSEGEYELQQDGKIRSSICLRVKNAKNSHGRANGEYRELLLDGISSTDLAAVMHWLEQTRIHREKLGKSTGKLSSEEVSDFYNQIQLSMRRALIRMLGTGENLPTIYSTRHQVVADMKSSNKPPAEIAAFLGHGSIRTANKHYGKKFKGKGGFAFSASPESINKVMANLHTADIALPNEKTKQRAKEWTNSYK